MKSALRALFTKGPINGSREMRRLSAPLPLLPLMCTKRTCRADLTMSVDGGRAEVGGTPSNRRD